MNMNSIKSTPLITEITLGVSVILCCHNSVPRLRNTLQHLARQKVGEKIPWEIVLINNASTDETSTAARRIWDDLDTSVSLRVIAEPQPGLSVARETGVCNSAYEFLLFCDDDNWLSSDYVHKVYERLHGNRKIGVLGGNNLPSFESTPPDWFEREQEMFAVGTQGVETGNVTSRGFLFGAGMSIRKSDWNRIRNKGYRSFLSDRRGKSLHSGGDSEICAWYLCEGYMLFYDELLTLHHFMPSERLTSDYLRRLKDSMAYSNAIIRLYNSLLSRRPDERNVTDFARGLMQAFLGFFAFPFAKSIALRKLAKAQIAFGSTFPIIRSYHQLLDYYAEIVPSTRSQDAFTPQG